MLMPNGDLKITDFGLCRVRQAAGRAYSFTQPSQSYRAPELLFNCKVYDGEAVDMWAIGCILAELMRALLLLENLSVTTSMHAWTTGAPTPSALALRPVPYSSRLEQQKLFSACKFL